MITAEFFKKYSVISGFKISGHADYGEYGSDVACACVSSAVQFTVNMITEVFGFQADVSAENNEVVLNAAVFGDSIIQKLFQSLILQLDLLSEDFKETINIKFTEV